MCSVHDGSAAFGHPQRRQQDGLQQNTFQRLLSDPYFSASPRGLPLRQALPSALAM